MQTMWAGRFQKQLDADVNDFNSSISFDARMFRQDIAGSLAHVAMLAHAGILTDAERDVIAAGLGSILDDIASGALPIDPVAEDIHMFVEAELTKRVGDVGKKLHTARSRNDQVAIDLRLYLMDAIGKIESGAKELLKTLLDQAEAYAATIMPGYTHLQRAQPITLGHHLMAYANMIERDLCRLAACKKSAAVSPLGCCALAGTTYPTDRAMTAKALGCASPCENSMDGVSDRDFVIELASCIAMMMMHLSRFSEEIILWCSWEFHFIELDDAYSTGSSIMPQKKNPDIPELVRGKAGRSYGNLMTLLTVMKGLPLAYNKDMQEDKEAVFDAVDTVQLCLAVLAPMLESATFNTENMKNAAARGFINATDCADYLTKKGVPFRDAYNITGRLVRICIDLGLTLDTLPMEEYKKAHEIFDDDIYQAIDLLTCVSRRTVDGGPAPEAVMKQIAGIEEKLNDPGFGK